MEKIESLALETISRLVQQGIPEDLVEASFRRIEFHAREITGGHTPYALQLFRSALRGWLHDAPPEATLLDLPPLQSLKQKIKAEPRFLEQLLDIWFLIPIFRNMIVRIITVNTV